MTRRSSQQTQEQKQARVNKYLETMTNKSDAEKEATRKKQSESAKNRKPRPHKVYPETVEVQCYDCGESINVKYNSWRKNTKKNKPFRCCDCCKKWQSECTRREMANMNDEEKRLHRENASICTKKAWANKSEEERKSHTIRIPIPNKKACVYTSHTAMIISIGYCNYHHVTNTSSSYHIRKSMKTT